MYKYQVECFENRLDHSKEHYNINQPVTEPVFEVDLFLSPTRGYLISDLHNSVILLRPYKTYI